MKINTKRRDIERLYEKRDFHEIFRLYALCSSNKQAERFKKLLSNDKIDLNQEQTKKYVVSEVLKTVREYNLNDDYNSFEAYKNISIKKEKELTKEELLFNKMYKNEIKEAINSIKGYINEKAYINLEKAYDLGKDICYTGIIYSKSSVDDAFTQGIRFDTTNILERFNRFDNYIIMLNEISKSSSCNQNNGCYLIKIPKDYIVEKREPIYYIKNNLLYLNPMFILMHVKVKNKRILDTEINNEKNTIKSTVFEKEEINLKSNKIVC